MAEHIIPTITGNGGEARAGVRVEALLFDGDAVVGRHRRRALRRRSLFRRRPLRRRHQIRWVLRLGLSIFDSINIR